jgi:CubicO group peptidase (beta-lactamase class C family)
VAVLVFSSGLTASPVPKDQLPADIDRYIESERKDGKIPGISIAVVRNGHILLARGYGVQRESTGEPMTEETLVDLASVSKSFSALAIRQLQELGYIQVDRPVRFYLPEFHIKEPASASGKISVRHLLEHTSGLTRDSDGLVPCCGVPDEFDLEHAVRRLQAARALHSPGKQFVYANCNYVLLAAIVERVSGMKFPEYMEQRVFVPLGMKRTTTDWNRARALGLAEPHDAEGREFPQNRRPFFGWYGSSMVRSSANDMALYLKSLLAERSSGTAAVRSWFRPWQERPYEWGWFVMPRSSRRPMPIVEHGGNLPGVNTAVVLAPYANAGVVVLINAGGDKARKMGRELLGRVLGFRLL